MEKNFAVIGGDLRIAYLAKMLAKENKVYVYGQEKCSMLISNQTNLAMCNNLEKTIQNTQIIISSIPFTKDGINIYAPFSATQIKIKDLLKDLSNKTFIAGGIKEEFYKISNNKNVKIIDLMEQEDLTILNTIATAEGAISDIILNTEENIHGSKILILGFGRVAKVLAIKLKALGADITTAARKQKDFAWMETLGFKTTNINTLAKNLKNYNVIINTVPHLILDESRLKNVSKESLLIDLASKPGGIDENICKKLELKFIWALAIPGKVAPKTSSKYIKQTIDKILKEGAEN